MESYIDRLSLKILETQGFRRVVNRTQREELLRETGRVRRRGLYEKDQLQILPEREAKSRELKAVGGFRLGQEGVTTAPAVEGGSYLYGEVLGEFNRIFGISLRY